MSGSHQQEAAIFDAAIALQPDERAAYLDRACRGDPALRQRIESLLKASESQSEFLDSSSLSGPRPMLQSTDSLTEKPGDRIGRYKLLERIDEGGCGVVYVAEQTEPVRRRVALKIIKLGMDTKSVVARFEAERQALALMDHPHIAKVLDAGATDTGRPFFVMELVRGVKITDYCDEKRLSTRDRLELFIQVCQAIQHAHQKGIIHRDIKPSNILVTINDGVAVPRVIDFGVAKATGGQALTDKTVYTAFEQFIGTPAYMSPEQAVLTSLDIDTRSDIYALGVLLYELLTGKTPFDAKDLLEVGLDAMRRIIRETEPPRPSTRLSTLSGQELSTTAHRRGLGPLKLVSELRGDLDWIVMKALEKDRGRRYETANGLAMDVARHMNNEPVVACPPSRLYRLSKLILRNKLVFAAGCTVVVSLVMGLSVSSVMFLRERAAREQAVEQREIARVVSEFLRFDLLNQASSYMQAGEGFTPDPNLTVREALNRAAERVDRFKDHPLQEAAVRRTIGNGFLDLREDGRAKPHLERALELYQANLRPYHPQILETMDSLALSYNRTGKRDQAIKLGKESLKACEIVFGMDHPKTCRAMYVLGDIYIDADLFDQGIPLLEKAVEFANARLGPNHPETLAAMRVLGYGYRAAGKFDEAIPLMEKTLTLYIAELGPNHPSTLSAMNLLATSYGRSGKNEKALPLFKQLLEGREAVLGPDHPDTLRALRVLAGAYGKEGEIDTALALFRQSFERSKAILGPDHPDAIVGDLQMANLLARDGKLDEATVIFHAFIGNAGTSDDPVMLRSAAWKLATAKIPEWRNGSKAVAYAEKAVAYPSRRTSHFLDTLAAAYAEAGMFDKAIEAQQEAIALLQIDSQSTEYAQRLSLYQSSIPYRQGWNVIKPIQELLEARQFAEAELLARESLPLREILTPDNWRTFHLKSILGRSLLGQQKYSEAELLLLDGYNGMREREEQIVTSNGRLRLKEALQGLVQLYDGIGPIDRAVHWRQRLAEFEEAKGLATGNPESNTDES